MGIDIYWTFQALKDGARVDVPSEYTGERDYPLRAWLREDVAPGNGERGYPPDFEVEVDSARHPVKSVDLVPAYRRDHIRGEQDLYRVMGEWGYSWLFGEEILSAEAKPEFAYFVDEVRRLTDLHGTVRFVFGFA